MTRLHVREWGRGDRVALLIHGLSASSRTWWQVGPALAAHGYRVLAPDLTGHGRSPRGRYSRERWADDLLTMAPNGTELAIGHSLGAVLLAMIVEHLHPQRAIYEDPAWHPSTTAGWGSVLPPMRAVKNLTAADLRAAFPRWTDNSIQARLAELADWDPDTTSLNYRETAYVPVHPLVPSLILRADPSALLPTHRANEYRTSGFELRTIPRTGHFIHFDDFDGFFEGVRGWV
ncbi:alpha/beta hydrolase [Nocardia terpenica]|uniref:alpha/beta fold hydrolase n=1 Tax=Nocardia terpenica TaxID=455432 RepID=UPI0018956253|nr:alpha/beta hydrolase [Nocardia terpenica]MBF6061570.1 alpha/beta hydrolase [Nocardia terpenica]MBF6107635.1 alpha/beta hydrolase [Nocardia terpenica]MBF6109990.1 alpha/beta hydrolase [Nocardia terpenica]MBF6122498.1 alpha/beta hydrolase [Nocardia terpenica]MBF6151326.1 alpha/beta hydrolase [Nocardia terpenica]